MLVTKTQGRSHSRGPRSSDKRRSKSRSKCANVECYYCHEKGHTKKFCQKLKRENKKKKKSQQHDNNSDSEGIIASTVEELVVVCDDDYVNLVGDDNTTWVSDSGATIHATSRRDFLTSYTPGDFGVVKMGNNDRAKIVSKGDVHLETTNGTKLILKSVRHVESLRLNIISVGKLDDEGYSSKFGGGQYKLTKGSMIIARGKKVSHLYYIHTKLSSVFVNALENEDQGVLWHKRLGHMSEKGMTLLFKKNVLSKMKSVHLKNCVDCLAGKQHRISFKSQPPSKKPKKLELIHSDVCGPMKVMTLGGARYFVTFIDDSSRKIWAYALKSKDQVLDKFKEFQASVERQTRKKVKCIRIDNGGEYCGPFDVYCKQQGIRH